ncbi:MAG: class C sortase [[Clostridium] scindens]
MIKAVSNMTPEDFDKAWKAAENFNNSFDRSNIFGDVFSTQSDLNDIKDTEYWKVLNVGGNGIMGYLSIPKINVELSIYHGTSDEVLQTGVGHLNGTKLPMGGKSTHSVLSAHRGLPSAKLFTDIDQMKKGDRFYLHILDKNFAYEVDQILSMVDKDDHETLEQALQIEEGQDYVTLFTCTPYGVNTHRLLVRGHRIPYDGEELESSLTDSMVQAIQNYYMLFLLLGLAVTAIVIILMKHLFKPHRKQARKDSEEGKK